MSDDGGRVRIDKWLWAARFFKTRAKAKIAIDGGKVECDGVRAKPAREISVGTMLRIRQGYDVMIVEVRALSERRGSATDAAKLYEETTQSREAREHEAARRRARRNFVEMPDARPERRDRRTLERIKKEGGL